MKTKKRKAESTEFFLINGHQNPIHSKVRVDSNETSVGMKMVEIFCHRIGSRLQELTEPTQYLLRVLGSESVAKSPDFRYRLTVEISACYNPKKWLASFATDFKDDDEYFVNPSPLTFNAVPSHVFVPTFANYIVDKITALR